MGSTARIPVVCDRRPAAERGICQVMDGLVALSGHESSLNGLHPAKESRRVLDSLSTGNWSWLVTEVSEAVPLLSTHNGHKLGTLVKDCSLPGVDTGGDG